MLRALTVGAGRCRALRALLRLRRRPRRDHRADLADAARRRPTTRRSPRWWSRLRAASRREAPQVVERAARPARRLRPLRAAEARDRRAARRRLGPARQAGAGRARRPRRHRDRGALARARRRPTPRSSPGSPAAARGPTPPPARPFRPVMLAHALTEPDLAGLDPADYLAEWKWDGIRVQAAADAHGRRLYSRTGDDISGAFPDLLDALDFDAALDGELLVRRDDGSIATFSDLQQRLNRKTVTAAQLRQYPAHLRAYDLLQSGATDLRPLPFAERARRARGPRRPARPGPLRPLAAPALRQLGRADRLPRRTARPGDRGRDAEAPRQPLRPGPAQGPLVEVEARPAHHRRGADVRPARPRQALGLLFRLYLRGLDRGRHADAGRQGLFRLHRRGAGPRSTASCAPTPPTASARCAPSAPSPTTGWCWRSPSRAWPARPATAPAWRCASRASAACAGTSRRPRPTRWRRWRRCLPAL